MFPKFPQKLCNRKNDNLKKKLSAFPSAGQLKTAAEYYHQTSTGFNKPMAFGINPKTA